MRQFAWVAACLVALGLVLSGCSSGSRSSDPFAGKGSPYYSKKGPLPKGGGRRMIGEPYQVAGRWFHPKEQPGYDKTGVASWYGPQFHRRMTSNGEWFDMEGLTAAHPTLPLPSYVKVTNVENGREIVVRVNDRGPFVGTRIIDMSKRAAEKLDFRRRGMAKVRVQYIGPAPLNDKGSHLLAMNRELARGTSVSRMLAAVDGKRFKEEKVIVAKQEPVQPDYAESDEQDYGETSAETVVAKRTEADYFVQVASFADPYNAERAREELQSSGPVQIQEFESSTGTLYRVRIGPLSNPGAAEDALRQAVDLGHPDARLVVAHAAL
jgi:rare lipoprotein A